MNTLTPRLHKTTRFVAAVLATLATVGTLQSVDSLASRDHGATLMARAASQVMAAATTARAVKPTI